LQAPAWIAESVAAVFQVAGWLLLGGAVIALAVAVARRVEPPSLDVQVAQARPTTLFGLDLDPAALPEDLLGAARRAWSEGHAIEAMSLLYRGALIRLVDRHGVAIPESATEFECLALVSERDASLPSQRFAELTQAWVGARYAASPPSDAEFDGLCRAFDHAFGATP
jgi:hypothetical protein